MKQLVFFERTQFSVEFPRFWTVHAQGLPLEESGFQNVTL